MFQSLLFGTVRHIRLLEKGLEGLVAKRPKPGLWATLLVASRELMETPEKTAQIVNHAVGYVGRKYSRSEKGLANAVLRKMPQQLEALQQVEPKMAEDLAWRYSHPQWLVERWLGQFGWDETRGLLEWNQQEPGTYARWQKDPSPETAALELQPTDWPGFLKVERRLWPALAPWLRSGALYIQNPGARLAPGMVAERFQGGRILDLCSAPGGKALLLERLLGSRLEELVAVDLPGPRFDRMVENVRRASGGRIRPAQGDARQLSPSDWGLYEAVLLDAPCSNTGVMQHKVDARWRLTPDAIRDLTTLQSGLLERAAACVAPGGTLVYSTCSIDRDENEAVVERFLQSPAGSAFRLEAGQTALPWQAKHDGAGAFALRRNP